MRSAALVLAAAVAMGALFMGAPPRFSSGEHGPPLLRQFLHALGPLATLEAAIAAALGLLVAAECLRREAPGLPGGRAAARSRLPLALLLAFGVLQLVPLPRAVLEVIAPYSARVYSDLTAVGDDAARPITLWTDGTIHALFNLGGVLAASAVVWTLVRDGASRERDAGGPLRIVRAVLWFVVAIAAFESVLGIAATKLGDDRILFWFEKLSGRGRVTGTFIHATMTAVWAGMGLCAALGLAAHEVLSGRRRPLALAAQLAAVAVCAIAAPLTISRLGLVGVAAGVASTAGAVAAAFAGAGRRRVGVAIVVSAVVLVTCAAAAALLVPAFRERLGYLVTDRGDLDDPRFPMWSSTLDLWLESPVVGTGLGAFGRAIHLVQSPDIPHELWFAHSDPLNLLSDAGVLGFLFAAAWVGGLVWRGAPAILGGDPATRCLAAGAAGGAAVVLVASLGDFQTQFPVVALPFAALLTVPAVLAHIAARPHVSSQVAETTRPWLLPPRGLALSVAVVFALLAAYPVTESVRRWSELRSHGATGATLAESLLTLGRARVQAAPQAKDRQAALEQGEELLREAARKDPLLDDAHLWLAYASLFLSRERDDVLRSIGRARLVSRGRVATTLAAGALYLDLLGTSPAPYGPPEDSALVALREAGAMQPQAFSVAWKLATDHDLPPEVLREIVPDRVHARIHYAEHLQQLGRNEAAIRVYEELLAREPWEGAIATRLAAAYRAAGRESAGREYFASVGASWPEE